MTTPAGDDNCRCTTTHCVATYYAPYFLPALQPRQQGLLQRSELFVFLRHSSNPNILLSDCLMYLVGMAVETKATGPCSSVCKACISTAIVLAYHISPFVGRMVLETGAPSRRNLSVWVLYVEGNGRQDLIPSAAVSIESSLRADFNTWCSTLQAR